MQGGGGTSSGGGANGTWAQLVPSVSPLPPNQYQEGDPARVVTPCFELVVLVIRYVSWWLPYATDWPGDIDLRAEACDWIVNPELWESIEDIYQNNPAQDSSRFVSVTIPEEVVTWRENHPHWVDTGSCIFSVGLEFAEIEGNPRVKITVIKYAFTCYTFLFPLIIPPIIPLLPLPVSPGHGFGGVGIFGTLTMLGTGDLWRKKRR